MSDSWNFALAKRGGASPGKRPATVIVEALGRPSNDGRTLCYILDSALKRRTKHPRWIALSDLVQTWPVRPSAKDITAAKAALSKTPE